MHVKMNQGNVGNISEDGVLGCRGWVGIIQMSSNIWVWVVGVIPGYREEGRRVMNNHMHGLQECFCIYPEGFSSYYLLFRALQ